jgi:ribosomal protein L28
MAKICEATGKSPMFGGTRQHNRGKAGGTKGPWAFKATRKNKKWIPNLRKVAVKIDNSTQKVTLSMKAYKKLKKDGKIWLKVREVYAFMN